MKIPGFNLWNWPTQRELEIINEMKALAQLNREKSNEHNEYYIFHTLEADLELAKVEGYLLNANRLQRQIKEREFLYYCHSGKFPK